MTEYSPIQALSDFAKKAQDAQTNTRITYLYVDSLGLRIRVTDQHQGTIIQNENVLIWHLLDDPSPPQ